MDRRWMLVALIGCAAPGEGLRLTPPGEGPEVVVDWEAEPLPELPFPNDLATTVDPTSPTGLRVNIATKAHTDYESTARVKLDELSGFGIYQPITVQFGEALDIDNVLARHPNDFHLDTAFDDDALFVINVDPDSPDYGRPVALDLGHGRYPMDVFQNDRYFPNDPRAESPSLLFETVSEDLDGDGVLDPGEDSDNDGVLDIANVWPDGADPVQNLLTWYDRETNTLIARPVVPLREETTYAVVLTNRLVGVDGEPVRSPWTWVNHTRQTQVLEPLRGILPDLGLDVEDVAFAWTYTTGRVTGDLRDLHRAIFDHVGPYAWLADKYPAVISEALLMKDGTELEAWNLETSRLVDSLLGLGVVEAPDIDLVQATYQQYSDRIVTGAFITPYLLADADDFGTDDADEWWKLDPHAGTAFNGPERVPFTCVMPTAREGVQQPFKTLIYGHGYGSNRLEVLYFGHMANRLGMAVCGMEFPGHGVYDDPATLDLARSILEAQGLGPAFWSVLDGRARDLNNDGAPDSGGDQWAADPFHTRDMVRQGVLDWMQMVKAFGDCGQGEMHLIRYETDGRRTDTGQTVASCDWDGDGVPDVGAGAEISIAGGSLGGINAGVAAAVLPEVSSFSPVVPGGGIVDIGVRTEIGGAVEAFVGRLMNPLILGYPEGEGLRIVQMVNSVTDMVEVTVATIPSVPAGGQVVVTNLRHGDVREATIPADGRFRVAIAADALDQGEKRLAGGIPRSGPEVGVIYEIPGNDGLGDPLLIEIYDAAGLQVASIDRWESDVLLDGITMRAGSMLVAGADGNGKLRGSYEARRLAFVMAMVLEPGDPIAYASHWFQEPFADLGGRPQNVLLLPNAGDPIVCVNTGIALARAAGLIDWHHIDERYGMTQDAWLIDRGVVRGIEERGPYTNSLGVPILFDADDLDDGTDGTEAPSDEPLRATATYDGGVSALRIPYPLAQGIHGFDLDSTSPFNWTDYVLTSVVSYALHNGTELQERPCFATSDCPEFPPVVLDTPEVSP